MRKCWAVGRAAEREAQLRESAVGPAARPVLPGTATRVHR